MSAVIEQHQPQQQSLLAKFANRFGVEPNKMLNTLKATAFKGDVSNEQMMALLIVADQHGLNPWTKEIYAFPDKNNGIVPVVGVDGWSRIINEHPQFDGMDFVQSEGLVRMDGARVDAPEWIECVMYRKDRAHPIRVREYLDEAYRPPFAGQRGPVIGPWQTHPKRFLRHKAMIQCARLAFGFVGIHDQDEAERIIDMGEARPASDATLDELNARVATRRQAATDVQFSDAPAPVVKTAAPRAAPDDAPPYTYAELEALIRGSTSVDALDELGALVSSYPADQQPDLANEIGRRRAALQG